MRALSRPRPLARRALLLAPLALLVPGLARSQAVPVTTPDDSVVLVRTTNSLRAARGSGFIIGDGGWVVTASHVVSADLGKGRRAWDRTVLVYTPWTGRPYEARVAAVDGAADIAVLRLPEPGFPALPVEGLDLREANPALEALKDRPLRLYGFPLAYGEDTVAALAKPERSDSRLKEIARRGETNLCVLNPCPDAQPGWSGGPVVGMDRGSVVAVFHSLYRPRPDVDPGFPAGSLTGYLGDLLKQAGAADLSVFGKTAPPAQPRPPDAAERMAHELRGLAWSATGNWRRAEEEQREVLKTRPNDPMTRLELGRILLERQQYEAAARELKEAARLAPGSVLAHLFLGRALHMDYDPRGAVDALKKAIEISPEEVEPQLALAQVHEDNQKPAEAEAVLKKALEKAPEHPVLLSRLGNLMLRTAREDEGLKVLGQASQLSLVDPGLGYVCLAYGKALEGTKRHREAEGIYRLVLKQNKNNALAYYHLAMYYLRQNRVEEAQAQLNAGISLPGLPEPVIQAFRGLQVKLNEKAGAVQQ